MNKIQANLIQRHNEEITYHDQLGFIPEKRGFRIGTSCARKTNHVIIFGALNHVISAPPPWKGKGQRIEFNHMTKILLHGSSLELPD